MLFHIVLLFILSALLVVNGENENKRRCYLQYNSTNSTP
jgi:ribosome-associated protein YbcJ (S4-like RNA binding protein)